jgi:hypothetical protein
MLAAPRLWAIASLPLFLSAQACGHHYAKAAASAYAPPPATLLPPVAPVTLSFGSVVPAPPPPMVYAASVTSVREESAYEDVATTGGSTTSAPVAPSAPDAVEVPTTEMLDLEARVTVEVDRVRDGLAKLHEIAAKHGASFIGEAVTDQSGSSGATLTLRVPSKDAQAFLGALEEIGRVRQRQVTVRDVGKEYFDAKLQLETLRAALQRYEQILAKAATVAETLQVEAELTRLRAQIEQVEGNLRYMKDRVARATVYVSIVTHVADISPTEDPTAKLYPGLRFGFGEDLRGSSGTTTFVGGGVSIRGSRAISLDVDFGRLLGANSTNNGLDLLLVTIGGEFFSDFLGGGKRRFFEPYLGFRAGYAHRLGQDEAVAGGTLGLALVHTSAVSLDLDLRGLAMFGSSDGAHLMVQPQLGFNVAF